MYNIYTTMRYLHPALPITSPNNFYPDASTRYGIPLSFVYCTVYQQNIWREGDEHLIQEQKKVWRDFFNVVDDGYARVRNTLNMSAETASDHQRLWFLRLNSTCWNNKVSGTFKSIDQIISNPKVLACKLYRSVQPYISSNQNETK